LRNAAQAVCTADQISAAGLRPELRAEQISVSEFIGLANFLAQCPAAADIP
jgi:16S rRNA (adenine1518-N6/adenine1519-N6)-dimethyltransferase